jgi:hypothetical protein
MEEPFLLFGPAEADGAIRLAPWRYFIDSSINSKARNEGGKSFYFRSRRRKEDLIRGYLRDFHQKPILVRK